MNFRPDVWKRCSGKEGHDLLYLGVSTWKPDVFGFLDEHVSSFIDFDGQIHDT
jgi:hypothetical protein